MVTQAAGTRFLIDGVGNVGIGTTSPNYHLEIKPGTSSATLKVGSWAIMENVTTDQAMFGRNVAYNTSAGSGWRNINTGYATAIRMYDDPGDGSIAFHLHGSETAGTNISTAWDSSDVKMTIRNGGNVGIGTANPQAKLQVYGNLQLYSGSPGNSDPIIFGSETGAPKKAIFQESYWMVYQGHDNEGHKFRSVNASGAGTDDMVITGGGSVGIGVTAPGARLDVRGKVNVVQGSRTLSLGDGNYANHILCDSNVDFAFNYNNGSTGGFGFFGGTSSAKFMCSYTGTLTVAGDVIAYGTPSDARLKTIKEKVPNALDTVLKLNGYRFDWKERELDVYGDDKKIMHIKEDIGVIAQEVIDVLPELARTNEDGYMSVRYQGLTAVLIEAIKEQQKQIDELKYLLQTQNK